LPTFFTAPASAQDAINNIVRASVSSKPTFVVFDIRGGNTNVQAVQEIVSSAFKVHYNGVKVNEVIAPYPLPLAPSRMSFRQVNSAAGPINSPECPQASAFVSASDKTMTKYGEVSVLESCIFQYKDGIRLNIYALFAQRSGGPDINILGAMLGRVVTKAMGIGDSSRFIGDTIDDIELKLKAVTSEIALVELQPAREGKTVVTDPAQRALLSANQAVNQAATLVPTPQTNQTGTASTQVSPQFIAIQQQVTAALQQRQAELRTQYPNQVAAQAGNGVSPAQARKELSAMGLTYYSREQFFEAIYRGDKIACELFLQGKGISTAAVDRYGKTPIQAAPNPEILALFQPTAQ
jgi:hypothetical protein